MKKAIVTGAFGERYVRMAEVTFPTMRAYAERIGAEFHALDKRVYAEPATPHWEKLQLRRFVEKYDRTLWFDADIAVRDDTPDLFGIVPTGLLGAWDEAPFGPWDYPSFISRWSALSRLGKADYPGLHFNTGVMVLDRSHLSLFQDPPEFPGYDLLWDQGWLNYLFALRRMSFFEITPRFNHMFIAPGERRESYIIHYCGTVNGSGYAKHIPSGGTYVDLIKADLAAWAVRTGS